MFKEEMWQQMELIIGAYETNFESNTIKIPKAWRSRLITHTAYCTLDSYESENDKILMKINCFLDRDDYFLKCVDDSELFTVAIDRKKRIHIPQKYIEICGFEANTPILLIGWGYSFTIQTRRDKIKKEDIDQLE